CGCLRSEQTAQRNYRHGDATRDNTTSLYKCWIQMKQRCLDPKAISFKNYGGRGITFAPEWIEFIPFRDYIFQNLGPRPKGCSIDRIENNEGYYPGNLKWSTSSEQTHNSRRSRLNRVVGCAIA